MRFIEKAALAFLPIFAAACDGCGAGNQPDGDGGSGGSGASSSQGGTTFEGGGGSMADFMEGGAGGGPIPDACKVNDDDSDNAVQPCVETAPADSFAPQVQWTWTPPPSQPGSIYTGSFSTPLVGNFNDDNADGEIDLCDTPEILVVSVDSVAFNGAAAPLAPGRLFMLRGSDGMQELEFPGYVDSLVYGAFGDIDNDGLNEVLWATSDGRLIAYENDGTVKWTASTPGNYKTSIGASWCATINIYDIDADGTPEILFGWEVYNAQGQRLWGTPTNGAEYDGQYYCVTPTAADLDGDGMLEVLFGNQTYHHDGTLYWSIPGPPSHPHVANLDSDPEAEVFLTSTNGLSIVDHDGTEKFAPIRPTGSAPAPNCWGKPAVVHDFDGNGVADLAAASCNDYSVYHVEPGGLSILWTQNVQDLSGLATATGFDFLGDGVAEAIYADETQIYVFDGQTGASSLTSPRTSGTLIEYPVVADVDNDGSAEIVYTSNYYDGSNGIALTVLKDAEDRWIPARRIWNQYSYHVTNVREDGTIPQHMKKSWQLLNTYRTNSQVEQGGDCAPPAPR